MLATCRRNAVIAQEAAATPLATTRGMGIRPARFRACAGLAGLGQGASQRRVRRLARNPATGAHQILMFLSGVYRNVASSLAVSSDRSAIGSSAKTQGRKGALRLCVICSLISTSKRRVFISPPDTLVSRIKRKDSDPPPLGFRTDTRRRSSASSRIFRQSAIPIGPVTNVENDQHDMIDPGDFRWDRCGPLPAQRR